MGLLLEKKEKDTALSLVYLLRSLPYMKQLFTLSSNAQLQVDMRLATV
jgi:hypothetical protein